MQLLNKDSNEILLTNLHRASSIIDRTRGLLGRGEISNSFGLWLVPCNWIHSFGMKFSIDCIYLDRFLRIRHITPHFKPWRMGYPVWMAHSVIEIRAGKAQDLNLKIGDHLHVVD